MKIPCETIVRFCRIAHASDDPVFRLLRLQDGKIIATDRKFMVVENIGDFQGTHYITVDDALLKQCEIEIGFSGSLEVTPNDFLKYTVAKTSFGYITENIGVFPPAPTEFDKWSSVVDRTREPLMESKGAMVWAIDDVTRLAQASPSGVLIFETNFNVIDDRPCIVRDAGTGEWCGFFMPRVKDGRYYSPAELPGWLK